MREDSPTQQLSAAGFGDAVAVGELVAVDEGVGVGVEVDVEIDFVVNVRAG